MLTAAPLDHRNGGIDTLRGLACILLVALHVIGEQPTHGLRVDLAHPLALFADLVFHLRMPLFAMLSGFVYAYRPVQPGRVGRFFTGKLRRIVMPYLLAATAFAVVNTVLDGAYAVPPSEFWQVYLQPYAQFWFLQAILTLFVVMMIVDTLFHRTPLLAAIGLLVVSCLLFLSPVARGVEWFSLDRTLYLAPFFAFGLVLNRIESIRTPAFGLAVALVAITLFAINSYNVISEPGMEITRRALISLGLGLTLSGALVIYRLNISPLAWLGRYSFTMYLYHLFPIMALQMVYGFVGLPDPYLGLALGLLCGLAGPVLVHMIALRLGGPFPAVVLGLENKAGGREETGRATTSPAHA